VREQTRFRFTGAVEDLPLEMLTDHHRRVLNYWLAKRGTGSAPRRLDIDPCDIVKSLPNLILWEVDGADYRCRLAGTEVCSEFLRKLDGIRLSEIPCPLIAEAQAEFDAARDLGLVSLIERTLGWLGRPHVHYRHLLLPLLDDAGTRHMFLSTVTVHWTKTEAPGGRPGTGYSAPNFTGFPAPPALPSSR
jgi:hypothetical protein